MKTSLSSKKSTNYLKIGKAAKILGVSVDTLRRWEKAGKITAIRTPGGTRLYSLTALKKINPESVADFQAKSFTTEELLKETHRILDIKDDQPSDFQLQDTASDFQYPKSKLTTKFLISFALLSVITLLITSWITASYLTNPSQTQQFFKNNIASGLFSPFHKLAEVAVEEISPAQAELLGFNKTPEVSVSIPGTDTENVLAVTNTSPFLEVNADTQINGSLFVRDSVNGLIMEATPSGSTFTMNAGTTTLTVTKDALLDQDVSTTATPTFNTLSLSSAENQLVFQSGGPTGTLTWTPTADRIITLPDATTTLAGIDNTQTLTNKSMSGSSNTFTNIPNSAFANSKITITAGTNLTGGGDINLGSSATIALKDSPSITGTLTVSGATTLSSTLAVNGTTALTGAAVLSSASLSIGGVAYTFPSAQGAANTALIDDGSGGLTWTSLATGGGWTVSGNYTYLTNASGNAGIGTATPGSKLTIIGNVGIGTSAAGARLQVNGGGLFGWGTASVAGPSNGLAVSGNVGIGTTSPLYALDVSGTIRTTALLTPYAQTKTVATSGADYTSIQSAIDSLTCSAAAPCLVKVMPGVYTENVTMKAYVTLIGSGREVTKITASSGVTVTNMVGNTRLEGFTIEQTGTTSSDGGVSGFDTSGITVVSDVAVNSTGAYGIYFPSTATIILENSTITRTGTGGVGWA
ncbi:MerR family DNA-binding transcriptional regulator, partial [Patescibacteria group bacterium]|nr:MerR family DNA-binding transcriptional regulator [Patescibacteria group bacterium]